MNGPPLTPDGRYILVRGRLWRAADPNLSETARAEAVAALMEARRAVGRARRGGDRDALRIAGEAVDRGKIALGGRGPVWWTDGAPDVDRRLARNTPYAQWAAQAEAPATPEP